MACIVKEGKNYQIYFYLGKKKFKRSSKTSSKKLADDLRKKIENEIATGIFKLENYSPRRQKSLGEFFEEAIIYSKTNKSERTAEREDLVYNNFKKFCGDIPLYMISVKKIEKYKSFLKDEKKFAPGGINLELRHLSTAFSLAKKYGYIAENPFKMVNKVKVPKKKPKFITPVKAEELLKYTKGRNIFQYIFVALNTGARISEIINMKWEDVHLESMIINIHGKGSKERIVPIPSLLYKFLKKKPKNGEYVMTGCRLRGEIWRQFRKYADDKGLKNITFHNLRDTYASWMVQNGVNLKVIQELLGHESIQTTLIYAHLAPDNKFEAVKVLDKILVK